LPLRGDVVHDYFDNLLSDSEAIRKRLASLFKLASIDAFDFLQEIGRDCVGAVHLLKENETSTDVQRIEGAPMSEEEVERHLIRLTQPGPVGKGMDTDDLHISLAGAQEKRRCYGITAAGCVRTARRRPRTSSNCHWAWLGIAWQI
jgi:serine/threonine-protein kinase HipA